MRSAVFSEQESGARNEIVRYRPHLGLVFAIIFAFIFLLHAPLLRLPYFWDEAGYYVPAARDIFLSGSLIPHTTLSNAHPPLVLCWLALWWKLAGYDPLVTRSAMLVVAAFSLLGMFRLALRVANLQVAVASTLCTALYPVFFAQSSMAHLDLAVAGFTIWGLCAYLEGRVFSFAVWFSLAALAKETAILAPMALVVWEILRCALLRRSEGADSSVDPGQLVRGSEPRTGRLSARVLIGLLIPLLPLIAWYAYHYSRTGYVFGNPEFFRYNVAATLNPARAGAAVMADVRLFASLAADPRYAAGHVSSGA
jgi:4-amino-4-deoxy-L-arabinose transferase-like glycosyltransferase